MEVKVGGWGNEVYYLYLLPTVALLALLLWRRRRMGR
jgi:MYXO-CTERM domain-containing protein